MQMGCFDQDVRLMPERVPPTSERILQAQLNNPLRLPKSKIARRRDLSGVRIQQLSRRVANGRLQHRIIKLRVIEQVEELGAELHPMVFPEREILRKV